MERIKLIESYLDGSMHPVDREQFEKSLAEDKELAAEFELTKDVNEAILDENTVNFRKEVRRIIEMKSDRMRNILHSFKIPFAASIIILIGLSLWQFISFKQSPQELYTAFYSPYQTDLTTRSAENEIDKSELAYLLYQRGEYEASFKMLKNYLLKNNDNETAHYYLGLNAMELKMYSVAIDEFLPLQRETCNPFALHAQWYISLAYLELGQPDEARKYLTILAGQQNMYAKKAKIILKKMK
jgi:hypothetical protein